MGGESKTNDNQYIPKTKLTDEIGKKKPKIINSKKRMYQNMKVRSFNL